MKPPYALGMIRHLLETANMPEITKIESFADVGAVGYSWPPHGLKITLTGGDAVYLSVNATASPNGNPPDLPDVFNPEDLNVPRVSRANVS